MFDFIRKHNKWMMVLLFVLIIPSFVFFGIEGYQRMMDGAQTPVAMIGKQKITQADWDNAHREEVDQLRGENPGLDVKRLDTPEAKYASLERMVQQRVLAAAANKLKLFASDQSLAKTLLADPAIVALRGPDGKLDEQRYRQLLQTQGMSPEAYEASVRARLSQRQVLLGVADAGGWITPDAAHLVLNPFFERRAIQVAAFKPADFAAKAVPANADLQTHYNAHAAQFKTPEHITVEYLVLDLPAVEKRITISEQDLKGYYEQNKNRYGDKQERQISHILIAADAKADAASQEAAKSKAEALLAELRKTPASFADLARKESQDPGSAAKGGDLGYIVHNTTAMPKAFVDAAFGLKQGEISPLVHTEYGYHIIQLTGVRGEAGQGFEAVRSQIEADLKKQQAQHKFAEAAEILKEDVFKNPSDLQQVASKLGLTLQTAQDVGREPAVEAQGALASRSFLQALFSPESVSKKQNVNPVGIAPNQLAAGRVLVYSPAEQKPFEAVKAQVSQAWVQARSVELSKAAGEEKLKEWRASPAQANALGAEITVSRAQPAQQPVLVLNATLRADRNKLPALEGVDLGNQGYAIVRVNKVLEPDPALATLQAQQTEQVAYAINEAELDAYYQALKNLLKVKILVPKPAGLAAAAALPAN